MVGPELTAAIDQVSRKQASGSAALARAAAAHETPERALGLRFSPGDRAVDLVTGQTVEVLSGETVNRYVQSTGARPR